MEITEFGADAFGSLPFASLSQTPSVNESKQVEELNKLWKVIEDNPQFVMGGIVMEYHFL